MMIKGVRLKERIARAAGAIKKKGRNAALIIVIPVPPAVWGLVEYFG